MSITLKNLLEFFIVQRRAVKAPSAHVWVWVKFMARSGRVYRLRLSRFSFSLAICAVPSATRARSFSTTSCGARATKSGLSRRARLEATVFSIKDIDWKATARSSGIRIRRYQAIRKHNILLVVDTGRHMAATSKSGSNKRDISIMAAGVLGYIVLRHSDLIGLVSGDAKNNTYIPFKSDDRHIEQLLRHIEKSTQLAAAAARSLFFSVRRKSPLFQR